MVNFSIELAEIGELPLENFILSGVFTILLVLIWQFSNILNAVVNFIKFRDRKK